MELKHYDMIGKTVMSNQGFIIGKIEELHIDKKINRLETTLIKPSNDINVNSYQLNQNGNIIIPIESLIRVKDIFVFEDFTQNNSDP